MKNKSICSNRKNVDVWCNCHCIVFLKKNWGDYFCTTPPHLEIYTIPSTDTTVITNAMTIDIPAPTHVVGPPASQSPESVIIPIMISFQIKAMMKPNAAAIATAIVLLISFMVTIFHLPTVYIEIENIRALYNNFEKNTLFVGYSRGMSFFPYNNRKQSNGQSIRITRIDTDSRTPRCSSRKFKITNGIKRSASPSWIPS